KQPTETKQAILVTGGENGAGYLIGGQTGFVPSFQNAAIVETTGAGDAFSAGFIAEAIKCLSPNRGGGGGGAEETRRMVRFAAAVGALTCGGDGAIAPQPMESDV
ncbi:unnamed protein product, partial [Laminaria digitata]